MPFYQVLGILTFLLSGILAGIVVLRRPPKGLWPSLFFVIFATAVWSLGETLAQYVESSDGVHWFHVVILYTGILMLAPSWWNFSLAFASYIRSDFRWNSALARRIPIGLAIFYWIALVTNPVHGNFITANVEGRNEYHLIWYCQALTAYVLLFLSSIVFLSTLRRSNSSVKAQVAIMLVGSLMPFVANVLYLTKVLPSDYDPTVSAMGISAVLYFWGIYRTRLFALSPFTLQQLIFDDEDVCLVLDRNKKVLVFNENALEFFGRGSLEPYCDGVALLESRIRVEHKHGASRFRFPEDVEKRPLEGRIYVSGSDGLDRTWLHLSMTTVRNRRGSVLGIGVRIRDLTDLVETSFTVDKQAATLEAILESADQGILVMNDIQHVVFANRLFRELWSIPEDLIADGYGKEVMALILDQLEEPDAFLVRIGVLFKDRELESNELIRLKSGRVIERNSRPISITDASYGRCWLFRDVTEELLFEEKKVRAEKRLRESQRLESLGVMAGGIAHDFNNLLFGVMGNAELMLKGADGNSRDTKRIKAIIGASTQAAELVNQMLSYAGQGEFKVETIHLSDLITETTSLLGTAVSKSVSLDLDMDDSLTVNGDVVQLRQVVMNLITNASESYEGGTGTVRVSMSRTIVRSDDRFDFYGSDGLPGGAYALLAITDHGTGMSAETLQRLFDPFFTTKFSGRGLGLAAVLGIVRSHGGALSVASTEGEGTTFGVYLPIYSTLVPDVAATVHAPEFRLDSVRGSIILVVDDESMVLELLSSAIHGLGMRVLTAKDGIEAIEIYKDRWQDICAVIIDLAMPRMGGEDALDSLMEINANVKVVVASGRVDPSTRSRLLDSGAVAVLEKPYAMASLLELL